SVPPAHQSTPRIQSMSCRRLLPPSRRLGVLIVMLLAVFSTTAAYHRLHPDGAEALVDGQPWTGAIPPGAARTLALPGADPGRLYSILFCLERPSALSEKDSLVVSVRDDRRELADQLLHPFDADGYVAVRPSTAGPLTIECRSHAGQPVAM